MTDRDPLQDLWTNQAQEPFDMKLDDIRAQATRFQARIRQRNLLEYLAGVFVVGVFGWFAFAIPAPVAQLGALMIVLGALYVCWKLHTLARAVDANAPDTAQAWTDFQRRELERQRTALATVWSWYLAPFAPGVLAFLAGVAFAPEAPMPLAARLTLFGAGACVMGAVFAAIAWLNAQAVKMLDREIATLDQMRQA
ncbi:hypothetical protein [Vitreimonas flagellata]|uniref:hypothetical protein n=1 Tax=Vitreimonas flagellata TaxID=2560861 RepID=UPI001074D98F|nr:hypothetical protein [Vitreimonas flagellata]